MFIIPFLTSKMKYIINLIIELSDKIINTIYRKILDNYSPYIPILISKISIFIIL